MKWIKKGLIVIPGKFDWKVTHAQNPFQERIDKNLYKIHFAGRDEQNRARGGYVVIDINEPEKILYITEKPLLDLGNLGCFDDSGVMPSCIISYGNMQYMYYTGWTRGVTVPYYFYVGLAISHDVGKTFERISLAPILERNIHDPYLTASPYVMIENGVWRMWYVSSVKRTLENGESKPYYHIKYAESKDGISWDRNGVVCINFKSKDEFAIARPSVLKEGSIYRMWYSYSSGSYRIGYAESTDGLKWERKDDEVGIDVSESGWDSEMICYPCVFDDNGRRYMLYNGNSYGSNGFGIAEMASEDARADSAV